MIFQKIYYIVSLFLFFLISSQLLIVDKKYANITKNYLMEYTSIIYQLGFNSPIFYSGKFTETDKVDIFVSNHVGTIDFCVMLSIIKKFSQKDIYIIQKKEVLYFPGAGVTQYYANDIFINRDYEKDKDLLEKQINKIKSGIIMIMPEGTRFSLKKKVKADEYCRENNLDIFENTLYPKMKGIYTISNILKKNNKLGNIIDLNIYVEKFHGKDSFTKKLLFQDLGKTFCIIRTYKGEYIDNYEKYKQWFLQLWKNKDYILSNIDKFKYRQLGIHMRTSGYIYILLNVVVFLYLSVKSKGIYPVLLILYNVYEIYKIKNKLN